MVRLLKKKYGEGPKTSPRPKSEKKEETKSTGGPNLQAATLEELKHEIERREEDVAEAKAEEEELRLEHNPCTLYRNRTNNAIERVVIIGGDHR
eukprot:g28286.t1